MERALGSRFPWLPESRLHKVSEELITRMAELGVDHYNTFTPELIAMLAHVCRKSCGLIFCTLARFTAATNHPSVDLGRGR